MCGFGRVTHVGGKGVKEIGGGGGNLFKDAIAIKASAFHDQFISRRPNGPHSHREDDTPGNVGRVQGDCR